MYFQSRKNDTYTLIQVPTDTKVPPIPNTLEWGVYGAAVVVVARKLWEYFTHSESLQDKERELFVAAILTRNLELTSALIELNKQLISLLVSTKV